MSKYSDIHSFNLFQNNLKQQENSKQNIFLFIHQKNKLEYFTKVKYEKKTKYLSESISKSEKIVDDQV